MTDIEAVIYGALMHHGKPRTIDDFERAARTVAEMLERRQSAQVAPAGEWRGLTEQERAAFVNEICEYGTGFVAPLFSLAESLEDVLKRRNTAAPAQQAEPALKCSRCGVDRLKQPCGDRRPGCPMTGEAQQEPTHD